MTASSKIKRLDEIESQLTPKEWAIRLADEMRKAGDKDQSAAVKAFEALLKRAMSAISKQVEEKHPGKKPEDVRAGAALHRALQTDFHALKKLLGQVNEDIRDQAEKAGLEAALKISTLQTIILQDAFVREPSGKTRDGRRKYSAGIVNLSIFQEFGFLYEDEEGRPINLDEIPKEDLVIYDAVEGPPLYAIPMTDAKGHVLKNKDGSIRRRRANGVIWCWASRFAELTKNKETAWVFYSEAIKILRRYLHQPVAFNLMFMTLFWKGDALIEMGHEKLVAHLDILGKDRKQVNRAIDAAFQIAYDEGIIEKPVQVRPAGYYKPTKKTGKERRKGMVYQWRRAARWRGGKVLPMVQTDGQLEGYNEGKTEKLKE